MIRVKYLLPALVAAMAMTACGPKGTVYRASEYSGEDFINIKIDDDAAPIKVEQPSHKSYTHNSASSLKSAGSRPIPVSNSKLNGQWIIMQAGDFKINEDEGMPYIIFSDSEGRFYASNGCNVLNGNYSVKHDAEITFDHVLSTMMICADTGYELEISNALTDGNTLKYSIEKIDNESYMTLLNSLNQPVLKMRRHNLEVINGQWEIAEIEGEEVDGEEVNVFFDIPELAIHGNTGCNFFNGVIVIDPNVASAISFAQMGVTMKSCPNHEIERQMLVALEETSNYELNGNTLILKDENGKTLIKLNRPK